MQSHSRMFCMNSCGLTFPTIEIMQAIQTAMRQHLRMAADLDKVMVCEFIFILFNWLMRLIRKQNYAD